MASFTSSDNGSTEGPKYRISVPLSSTRYFEKFQVGDWPFHPFWEASVSHLKTACCDSPGTTVAFFTNGNFTP